MVIAVITHVAYCTVNDYVENGLFRAFGFTSESLDVCLRLQPQFFLHVLMSPMYTTNVQAIERVVMQVRRLLPCAAMTACKGFATMDTVTGLLKLKEAMYDT